MNTLNGTWGSEIIGMDGTSFNCGYCGNNVGPSKGYVCNNKDPYSSIIFEIGSLLICPTCNRPIFLEGNNIQVPNIKFGSDIEYLLEYVESLYNEARNCISVNAFTSSVFAFRKSLMNVAVSKGATEK